MNSWKLDRILTIGAIAYGLKYFYSTASVDDLRWILAPTTFLVETITGRTFTFESHAGYMSSDHTFLIAASCSGVNFLIIAFVMLALSSIWRRNDHSWRCIAESMIVAFAATVVANTARIVVALFLHDTEASVFGISGEDLHRLEGIVVYFGCLLLLFAAKERFARWDEFGASKLAFGALLPISLYLGMTLGVPIFRGAFRSSEFWYHALFVLAVPTLLFAGLLLAALIRKLRTAIRSQ